MRPWRTSWSRPNPRSSGCASRFRMSSNKPSATSQGSVATPAAEVDDFLLLILSSPSGAGKTTLKNKVLAAHPELRFSVSHTTRRPRPGEVDGREYHFVDRHGFSVMVQSGQFAEWAEVHGNLYGTSLREIDLARATH